MLLEGLHAVKHAIRFGAGISWAVTDDWTRLAPLVHRLAPDLEEHLATTVAHIPSAQFRTLTARPPTSPLVAAAVRPAYNPADVLARQGHVVLLHGVRHAGNAGAVVRVAAAAQASGVVLVGDIDPWSSPVVRAAAGLQFAVPTWTSSWPVQTDRPVVAFDPDGAELLLPESVPPSSLLVFGGERDGLSDAVLADADLVVRLPMRAGVSSLNLATSVAAALYVLRYSAPEA